MHTMNRRQSSPRRTGTLCAPHPGIHIPSLPRRGAKGLTSLVLLCTILLGSALRTLADSEAKHPASEALRPNDLLQVRVYEHPELTMEIRVDLDYTIRFPMCGTLSVRNRLPGEVADLLTERLIEAKLQRVQVVVSVLEYAPRYVYVFGEVSTKASSALTVPPGGTITALQAISTAGGYTEKANLRDVYIRRKDDAGQDRTIELDLAAVMNRESQAKDVRLQVGDTVIVPSVKPIAVLGQVKNPGTFYLPQTVSFSVTQAVALAGGMADLAKESSVLLVRGQEIHGVDLSKMLRLDGDLSIDWALQPGDIIYVSESRW